LATLALSVEPGLVPSDEAVRLAGLFTKAERQCAFLKSVLAKRPGLLGVGSSVRRPRSSSSSPTPPSSAAMSKRRDVRD
jgi:hypothetical protein